MSPETEKINREIIARFGLGNAFLSLSNFIDEDELKEWQRIIAVAYDIDIDDDKNTDSVENVQDVAVVEVSIT